MNLTIEHDANFMEGRFRHRYSKQNPLPVQRLIEASYTEYWSTVDDFQTCPFAQMLDLVNSLMAAAEYNRIEPGYEWMEVDLLHARRSLSLHLQYGQAYNTEIREGKVAQELSQQLLPDIDARHFVTEGDPVTAHTFDFGVLRMTQHVMRLFVTWDED